ncbi:N-acetylglucosamine-6-phosphate deacetylase [Paraferrimonas sp. SM1919]|uniref:N-acetylglucosamine-6-phosphate deacetylase n=1 Tax=Paraferrimonas sp. SM1919 TaxID=2662263 RepID=UPI0013CFB7D9|nr:N-acetylglucosamine-6-phosphate deacetylase [Paraferrimonas sp. SM1919]
MANYIAERFFDGEQYFTDYPFSVIGGKIAATIEVDSEAKKIAGLVVPGFIDVQVNGGGGVLLNTCSSIEQLQIMIAAHQQFGTTALMPTLITDDIEVMEQAADLIAKAIKERVLGVVGIHFEGPHLSVPKKGVHSEQYIRPLSSRELAVFSRRDLGVKMVTLAPENVSADAIKQLVDADVKVCIGHSNADYQTTKAALEAGASGFTHLFNAMSAMDSRAPGVVGAALECPDSWCGIIIDNHHVHPITAKVAIAAKAKGKMMLVTDAMPPVGQDDNASFELFGRQVIRQGDKLTAPTGELAGCVLDMASAVRNTIKDVGLTEVEALRMASLYPAQFLGLDTKGHLKVGADADFVVLDNNYQVIANHTHSDWV